jgi:trehalose utilization protein
MRAIFSRRTMLAAGAAAAGQWLLRSEAAQGAVPKRRVVVWSEGSAPKNVYPKDINSAVAEGLKPLSGWDVVTASLAEPDQGLPDGLLNKTDVLVWWGHVRHREVKDELVERIVRRVKDGQMGFLALHSSHFSKALKRLLGTPCGFSAYVCDGSSVRITVKQKDHPIAQGIADFTLDKTERYSEPFQVPEPEAVVFDGLYHRPDGSTEPSRQGLVWTVGKGKVFYFQPGHETYPHFFDENVRKILRNAVQWLAPERR